MFRLYSKGCEYALRAMVAVMRGSDVQRLSAHDICQEAEIPEHFTRKVLQALVHAGYFEAARGPGGGYSLGRDPKAVSLLEFIKAVDGEHTFNNCILGLPNCGSREPCPLHEEWAVMKERLLGQLEAITIEDLSKSDAVIILRGIVGNAESLDKSDDPGSR